MIPVKVQCSCGQRYAFDVEPVNGGMPSSVQCPVCGADGTAAANAVIAQVLGVQPAPSPVVTTTVAASRAPAGGLRLNIPKSRPPVFSTPPPIPLTAAGQSPPQRAVQPKAKRGKDGWASDETQLNKVGTYITVLPPILAAMLPWAIMGIELPIMFVFVVVGVFGLIGGVINILGRGPLVAGAIIGLLIALGGYGAVAWWIHERDSVRKYELLIAFAIGAAPGMIFQYFLQQFLKKRGRTG